MSRGLAKARFFLKKVILGNGRCSRWAEEVSQHRTIGPIGTTLGEDRAEEKVVALAESSVIRAPTGSSTMSEESGLGRRSSRCRWSKPSLAQQSASLCWPSVSAVQWQSAQALQRKPNGFPDRRLPVIWVYTDSLLDLAGGQTARQGHLTQRNPK